MGRNPSFSLMTFSRSVHRQGNLLVEKNQMNVMRGAATYQGAKNGKTTNDAAFATTNARCTATRVRNAIQINGRIQVLLP